MKKNEAAVALGKLRAKTLTNEERSKGGLAGGKARAAALTPRRRVEIAKKAAEARWGKKNAASPTQSKPQTADSLDSRF